MAPALPASGLPIALALQLATVAVTLLLWRRRRAARRVAFVGGTLALLVTGATAVAVLRAGAPVHGTLLVQHASRFVLTYAVDGLSAWFLLVLSVVAAPIAVFSLGYVAHPPFEGRSVFIGAAFNVLLVAVELVFVAADAITFLFAWELMTLATAALVATEHESRANRRAAYLYLVMSHVGTGCLIAGFFVLGSATGSVSFATMLSGAVAHGPMRDGLFALFFLGFGVKAGVIPLHVWLPEAHPAAPTSISAFMSGVLLKVGIYGIVRVCAFGLGTPRLSWGVIVVALGGISALLGVLYALMQHDLKRLLAYHSIENIGIILLGLGAGMIALAYGHSELAWIGVAASLYHVLNHAVFKGLLFLGAGDVVMATGTRQIERYRRAAAAHAVDRAVLPHRRDGDLRSASAERLRERVAHVPGVPVRLSRIQRAARPLPVSGGRRAARADDRAGRRLFREGVRHQLPGAAAERGGRGGEGGAGGHADAAGVAAPCCRSDSVFSPGACCSVLGVRAGVAARRAAARGHGAGRPGDGHRPRRVRSRRPRAVRRGAASAAWCSRRVLAVRAGAAVRRVPTWGCGGELSARTEYTATAFSKPLMMIFRAVYRPARQVEALAEVSPYFPQEVHYHAEIEPTFERYVYGPLLRAVLRVANGMKVLQAGSLHAYLALRHCAGRVAGAARLVAGMTGVGETVT